jgi:RNA polymerase sigma-70 factor, ECF subfamily
MRHSQSGPTGHDPAEEGLSSRVSPKGSDAYLFSMEMFATSSEPGLFDARYLAFLETVRDLRPRLHRYCARMMGSVLDGEDVVQDALFQAYRKLETFDDDRPLGPWLFRIAHHRCVDVLRRRRVRERAEAVVIAPEGAEPNEPAGAGVDRAIEHLVRALPPKERACVLLKDVFDYSLEEIAELVDSTVGGVKAALNRGRAKLASRSSRGRSPSRPRSPDTARLLGLYVERFNRRDWDGLRELIATDARVGIADRYRGDVAGAPYFAHYAQRTTPWRVALGTVDAEPVAVVLCSEGEAWVPLAIVRITSSSDGRVAHIADYTHCPWVLASASSLVVESN